jgi:hypothetical protein
VQEKRKGKSRKNRQFINSFTLTEQVVQKIAIDALYLEPATLLGRFCPTVNYMHFCIS